MRLRMIAIFCFGVVVLGGCASPSNTRTASTVASPTFTSTPTATMVPSAATAVPTATSAPAATPTNVPSGWQVVVGHYFAIAYPRGWQAQSPMPITDTTIADATGFTYALTAQSDGRTLSILERWDSDIAGAYCNVSNSTPQTLAGAPMRYSITGNANDTRDWLFADKQGTVFDISLNDALSPSHIAQDNTLLATLRLASVTPFHC